ncbi:MAG: HypC/HybG/HupF family hydrogenase formation chaperone [Chitinivibrionales bacterium]|nr:HypC/HybG/HupF family hydrogenase formation chaperone [Chitinivibrionales bacterium]
MCLAVPARVKKILPDKMAKVDLEGVEQEISVELLEELNVGDYVIVHVGYALEKLDPHEAQETLKLFDDMRASQEQDA